MIPNIINYIKDLFSESARAAKRDEQNLLKTLTKSDISELKKISKKIGPALDNGLMLAKNATTQKVSIIEQKENTANNLRDVSNKFWKKADARLKKIDKMLILNNQNKTKLNSSEIDDLKKEKLMLLKEQEAYKHIEFDAGNIEKIYQTKREHDFLPLLKKANHVSKMINVEERLGAINPDILKQFEIYESSIIDKIEKETMANAQVDEYQAVKTIIKDLKSQNLLLQKELDDISDKKDKLRLKKSVRENLTQIMMLQNILHLGTIENLQEERLRKNALEIYEIINWIKNLESEEKKVLKKE